jgi:hypothetical protein
MQFLITRSVVNPRRAFLVNGRPTETLPAGTIATFGIGDDPDLSPEDEELIRLSRPFLEVPTPENVAKVAREIEAEKQFWQSRMDDGAAGACSFFGFRAYRGDNKQAAQ